MVSGEGSTQYDGHWVVTVVGGERDSPRARTTQVAVRRGVLDSVFFFNINSQYVIKFYLID